MGVYTVHWESNVVMFNTIKTIWLCIHGKHNICSLLIVAWRHQAITWTNVNSSTKCFSSIGISQDVPPSFIVKISLKVTHIIMLLQNSNCKALHIITHYVRIETASIFLTCEMYARRICVQLFEEQYSQNIEHSDWQFISGSCSASKESTFERCTKAKLRLSIFDDDPKMYIFLSIPLDIPY